ncbi:hypothetical protein BR93DRAFT_971681 [Coniochaeta sp. PMI_546]|nr:hypothetical protein BR93DRAFT_971681 [Coniochaeta sp. PMI_546]
MAVEGGGVSSTAYGVRTVSGDVDEADGQGEDSAGGGDVPEPEGMPSGHAGEVDGEMDFGDGEGDLPEGAGVPEMDGPSPGDTAEDSAQSPAVETPLEEWERGRRLPWGTPITDWQPLASGSAMRVGTTRLE